jgi:hypothetical protein
MAKLKGSNPVKPVELNEVPKTDCKVISYAHQAEPNGTRFRQMKADSIPPWAVNFKDEPDYPCNAWGKSFHETDSYIHWQDREPYETMKKLRSIYDKIILAGISKNDLDELLSDVHSAGCRDGEDNCNPDL